MISAELPLRPLTTGELLDRAFSLYRRNFWKFVGALAIAQGIVTGFQIILVAVKFPFPDSPPTSSLLLQFVLSLVDVFYGTTNFPFILTLTKMIIVDCLGVGALIHLTIYAYFGTSLSVFQAYRQTFQSILKLIGARLYVGIAILWLFVPELFSILGWLALIGVILFSGFIIVPMITIPIIVEGQPITLALARLMKLIMNRFWWVIGIEGMLILLSIVIYQMQLVLQTGFMRLLFGTVVNQRIVGDLTIQFLITQIFTMGTTVLITTFGIITHLFVYLDLRVRFESLDLALSAEQHPQESRALSEILFSLPTPDSSYKMTKNDLGQLTIGGWGAVGMAYAVGLLISIYPYLF